MGNIALIGMPACGKSTVGVQLAKWLSMGFIDTDLLVQARCGQSMQSYQDEHGMDAYRQLESDTVTSTVCDNCVIATGGSVVYYDEAMQHLKSLARIIFLDVPIEDIKKRIGDTSQRGVVTGPGMSLDDLCNERHPLYMRYADIVIECHEKTEDQILNEIRNLLR